MPCYGPLTGFYSAERTAKGKRKIVFDIRLAHSPVPIRIPCGDCVGCKLEYSRQWAMRCLHEKKLHNQSCFITLTYNRDHLPEGGSLVKRDLQLFMKRLRKRFGAGLRFYACGEYGDVSARPHYHVLLFNKDFSDRKVYSGRDTKMPVSTSAELTRLWSIDGEPIGLAVIGDVTFDSCAYVARYILKKVTGDRSDDHYGRVDANGRFFRVLPEFTVMSRGGRGGLGGIGTGYYRKFGKEVFLHDSVVVNGHEVFPPKFYSTLFQLDDPVAFANVRRRRLLRRLLNRDDNTSRRRRVKEVIALRKLSLKGHKL